jgi:hypothetical protein
MSARGEGRGSISVVRVSLNVQAVLARAVYIS